MKILDFSTLLPGPYASLVLTDLGADTLRIVSGSRPDIATMMPPFLNGTDISANAAWLGRGKRSITLNLKKKKAVTIIKKLIAEYDILLEQFRPGVMQRLGLGYEDLKTINPGLIYCSLTGYGQDGPYAQKAGHDINYLARSGLMSYSGTKSHGPVLTGMQIADMAAGSNNTIIAILAAVLHRNYTGKGQYIDISMRDGVVPFNGMAAAAALVDDGLHPVREEDVLNGGSLYDFYETKDNEYLSFGGLEPQFFKAFCNAIGYPEFIKGGVIPDDIEQVKLRIKKKIKTKTRKEWEDVFKQVDACVEPVLTLSETLNSPDILKRGVVVDVALPEGGTVRQLGTPMLFSGTPIHYAKAGQPAGTDNKNVLLELGYTKEAIENFKDSGIFN
ncbi:Crotonobetainyl-CoA:carnitine CoA-transferase CaiB [Desulfocicer vacuolatum DSM 3385]|uniref:Crotonobetainyl-CoA:carnitine CoA-transferase CaiB n=1 Tax=Desulfocicer vacuolatum DSM 3385 TaxID=1121400 RepID=A0A1W2EDI6_9BACT|nr:Crotonobetainyl-CoA:carnitine CoA-transferase CaiB [Desulfocicer vacuolatum DSM 3385]